MLAAELGRESTTGGWRRSIASCASNESSNERLRKCSSEGTGVDAMMDARLGYLGVMRIDGYLAKYFAEIIRS